MKKASDVLKQPGEQLQTALDLGVPEVLEKAIELSEGKSRAEQLVEEWMLTKLRGFLSRYFDGVSLEELNKADRVDAFTKSPEWDEIAKYVAGQQPKRTKAHTPQGIHHYTRLQQIDSLVKIGEDPSSMDRGFMTRMLTLCSLPRTDPGNRLQYSRHNGPYKLVMIAGGENKLPYGNLPRLLLAWVCTEAVLTQNRNLVLGPSLAVFMRQLGELSDSGGSRGERTRLKTQIDRLFNSHVQLIYEDGNQKSTVSSMVADRTELWWDYQRPEQDTLWTSRIRLGEDLFKEIIENPVPLDMNILKTMRRSSLGLDLYMWLSYKTYALYAKNKSPERLSWKLLYAQFGVDPEKADDKAVVNNFRTDVLRELTKLKLCWPALKYGTPVGSLEIHPCRPSIPPKALEAP
jgi:hypothetical protein